MKAVIFLLLSATMASANCLPRDRVVERLTEGFGEGVMVRALSRNGLIVEFWGNDETGSWSITTTSPSGETCLPVHGDDFSLMDGSLMDLDEAL